MKLRAFEKKPEGDEEKNERENLDAVRRSSIAQGRVAACEKKGGGTQQLDKGVRKKKSFRSEKKKKGIRKKSLNAAVGEPALLHEMEFQCLLGARGNARDEGKGSCSCIQEKAGEKSRKKRKCRKKPTLPS